MRWKNDEWNENTKRDEKNGKNDERAWNDKFSQYWSQYIFCLSSNSFDYGNVHIVALNSEGYMGLSAQDITPSSPMYKWLEKVCQWWLVSAIRSLSPPLNDAEAQDREMEQSDRERESEKAATSINWCRGLRSRDGAERQRKRDCVPEVDRGQKRYTTTKTPRRKMQWNIEKWDIYTRSGKKTEKYKDK